MKQFFNRFSLNVFPIPLFKDNFSYLLLNNDVNKLGSQNTFDDGILVDPAQPNGIAQFLNDLNQNIQINTILYTHKHWDHAGKCEQMKEILLSTGISQKGELSIISSQQERKQIQTVNKALPNNHSKISINGISIQSYFVPCHTRGHVVYQFEGQKNRIPEKVNFEQINFGKLEMIACNQGIFTGDSLFYGGMGKFFEGTPQQAAQNLELFRSFPKNTLIFCSHQYTEANLTWSLKIEKDNDAIRDRLIAVKQTRMNDISTVPSTIEQELQSNVFMRYKEKKFLELFKTDNPVAVLGKMREMRNKGETF